MKFRSSHQFTRWLALCVAAGAMLYGALAQAELRIRITKSASDALPVAIVPFELKGTTYAPDDIAQIVSDDLSRTGKFNPIAEENMLEKPSSGAQVNYDNWRMQAVDYLVIGSVEKLDAIAHKVTFQLMDVVTQRQLAGTVFSNVGAPRLRRVGHIIADMVYEAILNQKGAFDSSLAFVSEQGKAKSKTYELHIADSDGANPFQVLKSRRPILAPAWAPDGGRLAYAAYEARNQMVVYVQDVYSGSRQAVAKFKGINGSPAWSPDGRKLAVTLSKGGNPDIYLLDVNSRRVDQLTKNGAIDTEPAWAPDGSKIYFTSDRSGKPQIYRMSPSGGKAERVTFEGSYNASPTVSPNGRALAMVTAEGGSYRIAVQSLATKTRRVITDGPSDDSPSFAPNGAMIIYATGAGSKGELGTVSLDGRFKTRITLQEAAVREPTWSPRRQ